MYKYTCENKMDEIDLNKDIGESCEKFTTTYLEATYKLM